MPQMQPAEWAVFRYTDLMRQADAETARAKAAAEQARAHFKTLDDYNRQIDLHRSRHRELWEEARQYASLFCA